MQKKRQQVSEAATGGGGGEFVSGFFGGFLGHIFFLVEKFKKTDS